MKSVILQRQCGVSEGDKKETDDSWICVQCEFMSHVFPYWTTGQLDSRTDFTFCSIIWIFKWVLCFPTGQLDNRTDSHDRANIGNSNESCFFLLDKWTDCSFWSIYWKFKQILCFPTGQQDNRTDWGFWGIDWKLKEVLCFPTGQQDRLRPPK